MLEILVQGAQETADQLRAAGERFRVERLRAMRKILFILQADVKRRLSGESLRVRSGILRRSIGTEIREDGAEGRVGPQGIPYGRIHELGGEVRPVRARYLTIPLDAAKTPAGVARGRATDFKNTFFRRSAAGNLILFMQQGKGIVPLFVLKQRVRIPARPYLAPVMVARQGEIAETLGDAYMAALGT